MEVLKYFLGKLRKLQTIYKLKDNDTLGMYHEMYWREYIFNASSRLPLLYETTPKLVKALDKATLFFILFDILTALSKIGSALSMSLVYI